MSTFEPTSGNPDFATASEPAMTPDDGSEAALVAAALEKLRAFVASLPTEERQVLAALLAPAVTQAYAPHGGGDDGQDVGGFAMATPIDGWAPNHLSHALTAQLRSMRWEIATTDPEA